MKITRFFLVVLSFLPFSAKAIGYSGKDSVKAQEAYSTFDRNLDKLISSWHSTPEATDDADLFTNIDSAKVLADRPDTFYINRIKKIPSVIGLTYNKVVKSCIQIYTIKKRKKFEQILGYKDYYFPMFEEILDQYGLPLELKYLSVIESALNPRVVSHCGATGLWQFMFGTARQYHMNIDTYVDERCDAYAATHAAARYLKDLYGIYKDWVLVIAAYNCGPGNVNKAIRRSGGKTNYWDIYNYLPLETRGYFPAFIAATYSINFYKDHSLTPKYANVLPHSDTLVIKENIHLQQIADVLNIPIQQLRDLNPQYRRDIIPGTFESCKLRLPSNYVSRFMTYKDSIVRHRSTEFFASDFKVINPGSSRPVSDLKSSSVAANTSPIKMSHKVKKGETLSQIAKLYHVSTDELKEWNNITKVKVGKALVVYVSRKNADEKATLAKTEKNEASKALAKAEGNDAEKKTSKLDKEEKASSKNGKVKSKKELAASKDKEAEEQPAENASSKKLAAKNKKKEIAKAENNEAEKDVTSSKKSLTKSKKEAGKTKAIAANTSSEEQSSSEENVASKKTAGRSKKELASKAVAKSSKETEETVQKADVAAKKTVKGKNEEKPTKTLAKASKEETAASEKVIAKNTKATTSKKGKIKDEFVYYEVKKGDTLFKIAKKYSGVTDKDLMAWNELSESNIHPGQTIKIKKVD